MELFNVNGYNNKMTDDTLELISVRLRIDYENSDRKNSKCDYHSLNEFSLYCRLCKETMCLKCEPKHSKHDTVDKNKIVSEKIDDIASLIEKFCHIKADINDVIAHCDGQRATIYKDQKSSFDNIEAIFNDLHRQIDVLKSELLQELYQVVESCLSRLDVNKIELSALHDDVSSITDLVVRENSAFQYYNLFELEEYTSQKLHHYKQNSPLDHLRPNELNIQVKWTDSVKNIIKLPLGKINCHISPEKLSYLVTVQTRHNGDKHKSHIESVCCDRNNVIYLCDTSNNKIKVLNQDYSIERSFVGVGKHKLVSPSTILPLAALGTGNKCDPSRATVIVADPGSQNVVTFNHSGQGVDLFVTNGTSSTMCSIGDLNELENLQESFLELSPIYSPNEAGETAELDVHQPAVVLCCSKLDSLYLEFLQINPDTLKLCKSRPDLTLSFFGANNSFLPKCIAWNSFSKYLFLLNYEEHKVLIFSGQDGRLIRVYGRHGNGYEEFNEPTCILVDKEGLVLISDMQNSRIHLLDSMGNFVKFLFPYSHKYPICKPSAMCFDNDNNLIICEKEGTMKIYTY